MARNPLGIRIEGLAGTGKIRHARWLDAKWFVQAGPWVMMIAMKPTLALLRSRHQEERPTARLREPRGTISAEHATERLRPFVGAQLGAADSSMGRLVLAIATHPMHLLVVAGSVSIELSALDGSQAITVCHEPGSPEAVAAAAAISGRNIIDLSISKRGDLRIEFERGSLAVPSDPAYEAWEIRGMDGGLLACLPGGSISLWVPSARPDLAIYPERPPA